MTRLNIYAREYDVFWLCRQAATGRGSIAPIQEPASGVKLRILLLIRRIRLLDAGEIEQHRRHRRIIPRKHRCPHPHAFGAAAAAERNYLALRRVALADEQRPAQQTKFLIGEQTERGAAQRAA